MSLGILSGRFTMHGEGVRNVFSSRTEALRRITRSKKIYVATRQCANNERNQTHPHSPSFRHSFPSNSAKNQATIDALERLPQRLYSNDALACRITRGNVVRVHSSYDPFNCREFSLASWRQPGSRILPRSSHPGPVIDARRSEHS